MNREYSETGYHLIFSGKLISDCVIVKPASHRKADLGLTITHSMTEL